MNIFDSLPEALKKIWEEARQVEEVLPELKKKAEALKSDPLYYAEYLKAEFAIAISNAMKEKKLNKNTLAEKLGLSRQYVGRVLNENANFTIETMAAFALALGKRVEIKLIDSESL
jgi:DNA-binding phage protein